MILNISKKLGEKYEARKKNFKILLRQNFGKMLNAEIVNSTKYKVYYTFTLYKCVNSTKYKVYYTFTLYKCVNSTKYKVYYTYTLYKCVNSTKYKVYYTYSLHKCVNNCMSRTYFVVLFSVRQSEAT